MRVSEIRQREQGERMSTSYTVTELGLYASECCLEEVIFDVGDCFTRCPHCEGLCNWELVQSVLTAEELDRLDSKAA